MMGPYAHRSAQTTGKVVEAFYEQPLFLVAVVLIFAGILYWKVKSSDE